MGGVHMDSVTFDEEFLQTIKMSLSSLKCLLKRSFVSLNESFSKSLFHKSLDVFFGDPLSKTGPALIAILCDHCYDLIKLLEYINTVLTTRHEFGNAKIRLSRSEVTNEDLMSIYLYSLTINKKAVDESSSEDCSSSSDTTNAEVEGLISSLNIYDPIADELRKYQQTAKQSHHWVEEARIRLSVFSKHGITQFLAGSRYDIDILSDAWSKLLYMRISLKMVLLT
ncbi:hypothetical protein HK099_000906 [Clydaea vesicula]|uniref:Uncharacterized protein n=1 Tax=Clydaea vesicula TaxID=447962 RepID=A0AAD5XXA2_9FUNG|nr:hypothetical protein HK099_000906 [Clydaea vesicula]